MFILSIIEIGCTKKGNPEIGEKIQVDEISISEEYSTLESTNSQDFKRIIELKNPRMSGEDILMLQNQLLSLGFHKLGEADGYYGSMTEDVVKNVQDFSGFIVDGKVDKILWDYIFDNSNNDFLSNISTILEYNMLTFEKSRNFHSDPGDEEDFQFVYYDSRNKQIKIIQLCEWGGNARTLLTYYLINENTYFIRNLTYDILYDPPEGVYYTDMEEKYEELYYFENNMFYEINGASTRYTYGRKKSGSAYSYLTHIPNEIIPKFKMEYGW